LVEVMSSARSLEEPVEAAARHAEQVYSVAEGGIAAPDIEEVSTSWRRSARTYGVNPADSAAPHILTHHEIEGLREPLGALISSAREEIDRLHQVVRKAGYTILLCDAAGVAVEHRGEDTEASQFKYWGTWLGGVWSEEIEGTNGIGTCIAEERPITVHRGQHFRSRHIDLSCSGAPIFDVDGRLLAVLDVSAIDPGLSEQAHALTGTLTTMSARAIEERFFRERFRREWVVAIAPPEDGASGVLLAVDGDQRIVGANRAARSSLSLGEQILQDGVGLWTAFARNADLICRREGSDFPIQLVIADTGEVRSAIVTPPESSPGAWRNPINLALHARPRLDLISVLKTLSPAPFAYGGLAPGALRRVREYIETHLGERMQLAELAAVAGLSVHHFAREFKHSTGATPHSYLTRRRVERAREMLARTSSSLSEIALAAGFSDQSHLARHFRQFFGTTPGEFRWSQR
jgi:AraC-like DNA-binding protein